MSIAVGLVLVHSVTPPALVGFEIVMPVVMTIQSNLVGESFATHIAFVLLVLGVSVDCAGVSHQVGLIVKQFATHWTWNLRRLVKTHVFPQSC